MPPVCLLCSDELQTHDALCAQCWQHINFIMPPLCERTGQPLPYDIGGTMISAGAIASPPAYDRARAVAQYEGAVQELVLGLKYGDRHDLRRLLGRWMAGAGQDLFDGVDLIVPVPLHRHRLLSRRFNQAAVLALEVARHTGLAYQPQILLRIRKTDSQTNKSATERRKNVAGAFAVARRWERRLGGKNLLLVDDVITTGATVNSCARCLKRAGAARVDVLAVAKRTKQPLATV